MVGLARWAGFVVGLVIVGATFSGGVGMIVLPRGVRSRIAYGCGGQSIGRSWPPPAGGGATRPSTASSADRPDGRAALVRLLAVHRRPGLLGKGERGLDGGLIARPEERSRPRCRKELEKGCFRVRRSRNPPLADCWPDTSIRLRSDAQGAEPKQACCRERTLTWQPAWQPRRYHQAPQDRPR